MRFLELNFTISKGNSLSYKSVYYKVDCCHNWYTWGKCEIQERVKCNVLEKKLHWTKGGPVYHVSYLLQLIAFLFKNLFHSKQFNSTTFHLILWQLQD